MIDLLRLAWLNTYRQKQRTAITSGTVALATLLMIILFVLSEGFVVHSIENFTSSFIGKIQAHGKGYREDFDFYTHVEDVDKLLAAAQKHGLSAAPRSYGYGLAASGQKSAGAMFIGVDAVAETSGFKLSSHLAQGQFLSSGESAQAIIGHKLAINLNANVGDELVVLVQGADGSLGNMLLTVSGVFGAVSDEFDRTSVMINQPDFSELFASGKLIHEVSFNAATNTDITPLLTALQHATPTNEVISWQKLYPSLAIMSEMMTSFMLVFAVVFGIGAAIGVLNTLLMACFERIHEFGIMKAIGTSTRRIFAGTILEGFIIGSIGALAGVIAAVPCVLWLQSHGIDMSQWMDGVSVMGVTFSSVWRAQFYATPFILVPSLMIGLSVLAAVYPAIIVSRLNPTEAMRER